MRIYIALVALLVSVLSHAAPTDDLARNKALVASLQANPYGRHRMVKMLPRGDERSPLLISLPVSQKLKPYPILFVILDGNQARVSGMEFAMSASEVNAIYVGVPSSDRVRDYSSKLQGDAATKPDEDTKRILKMSTPKGDEFVTHLARDIVPSLEKEYGPFSVKVLIGGSLGGITALDTLLTYPESFDAYGALNPSLWYNYNYYEDKMEALARKPGALNNKCLIMSASEDEGPLATAARKFDRLLVGLDKPSTFRYAYRRLTELEHSPAVILSHFLVPPFIFNVVDIIPDDELAGLSLEAFASKLDAAIRNKTCFSHATLELTLSLYKKFGIQLVKENRLADAFSLYTQIKKEDPSQVLGLLTPSAFLWPVFDKLTKEQKTILAKDYMSAHAATLQTRPEYLIHYANRDLVEYARANNIRH